MHRMIRATAVSVAFFLLSLADRGPLADPLHKFGTDGAWCHVDSGWMFPKQVGEFARVSQPYNIDGNSDAGAEYRQASGLQAEVEIFAADSAAAGATLDGAKASATGKAGRATHVQSETPFEIDVANGGNAVKVTYAAEATAAGAQTSLYFFTTDRWRVKVLASTQARGEDGDRALDAFVRALPWNTLGTDPGIH